MFSYLPYLVTVHSVYALDITLIGGPLHGPALQHINDAGRIGLLWASIGLAVLTSFLQGFAVTIVTIAEDQDMWTFRFRIALYEHIWWTVISSMLSVSFILIILSFLSGNTTDSLCILVLSTATSIAIVRYTVPAWRNKHFVRSRWLAWTGNSRTAIQAAYGSVVGNADRWRQIARQAPSNILFAPSDEWGWAINPPQGIHAGPTALLNPSLLERKETRDLPLGCCVYDDGYHHAGSTVSLFWGQDVGFRPRVSRGINSVPRSLLASRPFTDKGYKGEGLCLAMGILGRNKGLRPFQLVFEYKDTRRILRGIRRESNVGVVAHLENTSVWSPRPNKVMRSYYDKEMREQFGTLGDEYVGAAVELAVILLDCSPRAIHKWFSLKLEQQSMEVNQLMSGRLSSHDVIPAQLQTLYRASYTSMVLSLNYIPPDGFLGSVVRPDLICFALLWLAEASVKEVQVGSGPDRKTIYVAGDGAEEPEWWRHPWVGERLRTEKNCLDYAKTEWRDAAAWLLGLASWPEHLDNWPEWKSVVYGP